MEQFALGLISGGLLTIIQQSPGLAWRQPAVYAALMRRTDWLFNAGFTLVILGGVSQFFRASSRTSLLTIVVGLLMQLLVMALRAMGPMVEELRRKEADESRRQNAQAKASFKPYEPLRARRGR